jgi:hypothetical protein
MNQSISNNHSSLEQSHITLHKLPMDSLQTLLPNVLLNVMEIEGIVYWIYHPLSIVIVGYYFTDIECIII